MFGTEKKQPDPPLHRPPLIDETTGKTTTVEEVMKNYDAGKRPVLKERTEAERRRSFQRKRRLYALTRTVRIVKARIEAAGNAIWEARDFVVIGFLMVLCWVCGYWSKEFKMLENKNLTEFLWIVGSYFMSVGVAVIKITMKGGSVAKDLVADVQKENVDDHGRTL